MNNFECKILAHTTISYKFSELDWLIWGGKRPNVAKEQKCVFLKKKK